MRTLAMSALLSAIHNTGHSHVPLRQVCLSSSCARLQTTGATAAAPDAGIDPSGIGVVTDKSAYRLHKICSCHAFLGPFSPRFVEAFRRTCKARDHRPLDSRMKRPRYAAVGRQPVQKLIANFFGIAAHCRIRILLCAQAVNAMCGRGRSDLALLSDRRPEWCCRTRRRPSGLAPSARPAPPADGLDGRRLLRRLTATRWWLSASDMPLFI